MISTKCPDGNAFVHGRIAITQEARPFLESEWSGGETPNRASWDARSMTVFDFDRLNLDDGVCPTCGHLYNNRRGVLLHHKKTHGISLRGERFRCEWCNTEFRSNYTNEKARRFCSYNCRDEWQSVARSGTEAPSYVGAEIEHECEWCGGTFKDYRSKEPKFCSTRCYGKHLSEHNCRSNHPLFNGGSGHRMAIVRALPGEWLAVRRTVADAAGGVCEMCGEVPSPDRDHSVHHTVPVLAGGVNDPDLLLYLCPRCHVTAEFSTDCLFKKVISDD